MQYFKNSSIFHCILLSLIKYYGGKYFQTPKYLPYIEKLASENHCYGYVEVTAGGARTLLNLPRNLFNCKIYNEYDYGLCQLFSCVKDAAKAEELMAFLKKLPYDRQYFEWAKKSRNIVTYDDLTNAALTYLCAMQSRNGDMEQFNLGSDAESNEKIVSSFYRGIDKIQNVTPVLKDTTITSVDFRDVLELYQNDKQILKFIDPPYHPITRSSSALDIYPCELTIADHKEMVKILVNSNSWILCGYDPVQYGCGDYIPLEESGAKKVSMGYFHLGTSNKNGYSSEKEEFIWIKY